MRSSVLVAHGLQPCVHHRGWSACLPSLHSLPKHPHLLLTTYYYLLHLGLQQVERARMVARQHDALRPQRGEQPVADAHLAAPPEG